MGMTLKELLTKGEGTLSAQEAKALAAQCRMDLDTLYTLLEERGIKIQEEETEPGLDVEGIMAEVENAENNNDDLGIGADEDEDQGEENPADLKAAMDELLDDPVKILATVLSALIAMGAVKLLSRFVILYGRRKFAVYLIIGILEKILFTYLYFGNSYMFYNLSMTIGYLVPGILGGEMEKQGIAKTLGALTVVVLLVRMLQVLLT